MVSTEYPPMHGGVGRYTYNLVKSLRSNNLDVKVVSDSHGSGDYHGLSPHNKQNSEVLLNLVQKCKPDIVHIQHEHGLYGFYLNPLYPPKTSTGLDKFYDKCTIPIVTTFHTSMHFKQWMQLINTKESNIRDILRLHLFYKIWRQLINYTSLHRINKRILSKSAYGIVFSEYMKALIPGTNLIFHGSEPWSNTINVSQKEAREKLGLPPRGRLALAQGHLTSTKGWDIIRDMKFPKNWKLVVNYSKNFYNTENTDLGLKDLKLIDQVINLNKQYLSEEELSLLFFSCDVVFLPYKVSSGSGVMYDGLAHGKPFIASDIGFFKEFSETNLGIVTRREPHSFEKALVELDKNYGSFESAVNEFRQKINWSVIARQHHLIYKNIVEKQKITMEIASTNHINQYSLEY
jgi:glycosyltransferase involved in cell wall biosynthesis